MPLSVFKEAIRKHFDAIAPSRNAWKQKNRYYHAAQEAYLRFLIPPGKRVLELGCGTGELLNAVAPAYGVGIDISAAMVQQAAGAFPLLTFIHADGENARTWGIDEQFDYIVISDTLGLFEDIQATLQGLHPFCDAATRVVIGYYNFMWEPVLRLAEKMGLKMSQPEQSWLSADDIENLLALSDFETVKRVQRLLLPARIPVLSKILNYIEPLPLINPLCLCNTLVARPFETKTVRKEALSVSVVIPCRNERGNIEAAVTRIPRMGKHTEIIFVDGHSEDGTPEEIRRVMEAYPEKEIRFFVQDKTGKGDAVRKGFKEAGGDILMILDADLTVAPEDLPKFYDAISSGKGEFINGCRLVYPLEEQAMRLLNMLGNKFFSLAFSWLLNQRIKDTLCGTKVLSRENYTHIVENRSFFGEFDPFGDFDLLFGASKLNLKILEIPIRYRARTYGETQISRFRHGWLLLKMTVFAFFKLKVM